jgi:hypothetical protein
MSGRDNLPSATSRGEVDAFLEALRRAPTPSPGAAGGRLMFALDATASREPTWDRACHIQGQMFEETAALGGLQVQLVFYRGFGELRASPWVDNARDLLKRMTGVHCLAGRTQIARVLKHAANETKKQKVSALVFVGDCMEEEVDELGHRAGELGMLGVPVFLFHEGGDRVAAAAFKQIAQLSGGAYCRFDAGSADQLRDLLRAVAVFAAGGQRALADFSRRTGGTVLQLTHQMNKG